MRRVSCLCVLSTWIAMTVSASGAPHWIWKEGRPQAHLVRPMLQKPFEVLVPNTLNEYLAESYGWSLPTLDDAEEPGLYIVAGNDENNLVIGELVAGGLKIDRETLGHEGYRILTHEAEGMRYVIITANTPAGLKFGMQELMYFHMPVTADGGSVEWPLDITRRPAVGYRGVYMLPCWSAHDSLESWKRVLKFHSELTLNRNWFWLAGFPVLAQYGGEYAGTDLADMDNVQGLVSLCRAEAMKFYIGGGWFTWHHEKIAGGSIDRGIRWYLEMVRALPEAEGVYLEPSGEGSEVDAPVWQERTEALDTLTELVWRERPEFEFALAIGKFNDQAYREAVHQIDQKRIYWWWCWGDPAQQEAIEEHPLILRWHTIMRTSQYHGSPAPPGEADEPLAGVVTSHDPGQGFGNPWNGWARMGVDKPREVHPRTMPYFSHQYLFRERCWDLKLTPEQFAARMQRRLFDADAPAEAVQHYLKLAELCPDPKRATGDVVAPIASFVEAFAGRGTPRQQDTLSRMAEALDGLRRTQPSSVPHGRR